MSRHERSNVFEETEGNKDPTRKPIMFPTKPPDLLKILVGNDKLCFQFDETVVVISGKRLAHIGWIFIVMDQDRTICQMDEVICEMSGNAFHQSHQSFAVLTSPSLFSWFGKCKKTCRMGSAKCCVSGYGKINRRVKVDIVDGETVLHFDHLTFEVKSNGIFIIKEDGKEVRRYDPSAESEMLDTNKGQLLFTSRTGDVFDENRPDKAAASKEDYVPKISLRKSNDGSVKLSTDKITCRVGKGEMILNFPAGGLCIKPDSSDNQ